MVKTCYSGHDKVYQRNKDGRLAGWDSTEAGYDTFKSIIGPVLELGNAPTSGRLLELGCGAGNMTIWLAERGYEAYGVDISHTAIAWAREKALEHGLRINFSVGDVLDLVEYTDGFFDFVFDGHCLHCIIGKDRERMLTSVRRVLKPRGYFLVDTMCGPVDASQLPGYDPASRCTVHGDIASRYLGMPDDILSELASAGFRIVRWEVSHTDGDPSDTLLVEALSP
jgi:SAM-dependent methyltransferase